MLIDADRARHRRLRYTVRFACCLRYDAFTI